MTIRTTFIVSTLLATGLISGAAQAALVDRGGGLIYDDVLDITWLQNANYGAGSSYDNGVSETDGRMTWNNAMAWADSLVYHDSVRNVDYSDWRLPTMIDTGNFGCDFAQGGTDCGYNVQTYSDGTTYSEMAYMYYVNLGLKGFSSTIGSYQPDFGIYGNGTFNGMDQSSYGENDVGLIDNLQGYVYWSGLGLPGTFSAWAFATANGFQNVSSRDGFHSAWAVRSGDVAAVPEPGAWALMMGGLALVGVMARRRTDRQA
jgi:hypothetical protein